MSEKLAAVLRRNVASLLAAGDMPGAAEALETLLAEDPISGETRALQLDVLLRCGRMEDARALAAQLVTLFPASPRVRYLAGKAAYLAKDYVAAAGHFEESHRLHPAPRTQRYLGKALTQMGKLGEAEAILLPLVASDPDCLLDLAWLLERKGEIERAVALVEQHRERRPGNQYAHSRLMALRAKLLDPAALASEVETLIELEEVLSEDLIVVHTESLFRTGQGKKAREFLEAQGARLGVKAAGTLAWALYKLGVHDLAFDLFLRSYESQKSSDKYFSALEKAAGMAGKLGELLRFYRARVSVEKRLFGRIRTLERRMGGG